MISTAGAFQYRKFDRGEDTVRQLLQNMPDADKRQRNEWTIYEGVRSRYLAEAVQGFDDLLGQFDTTLSMQPWLAGQGSSLADIAYALHMTRLDHLQMSAMWDRRPAVAEWYSRLQVRKGYQEGLARWFNGKYLALMEEKGREAWPVIAEVLERRARVG